MTWDLRVPEVFRAHPARQGSLEDGAGLGVTEQEACPDKRAPRVTAALMAWPGCLVRRATGVTLVLPARRDPRERMEKGVMTEKSGPGGCRGSRDHVVCLGQRGPRALQDHPV